MLVISYIIKNILLIFYINYNRVRFLCSKNFRKKNSGYVLNCHPMSPLSLK